MLLSDRVINNLIDSTSSDAALMLNAGVTISKLPRSLVWGIGNDSHLLAENGSGLVSLCELICINSRYSTDSRQAFHSVCKLISEHCNPTDEDVERIGMAAFSNYNYMDVFLKHFGSRAVNSIAFSASLITEGFLRDAPFKMVSNYYDALNKLIIDSPEDAARLLHLSLEAGNISVHCISRIISHSDFLKKNPLLSASIKDSFFSFIDSCSADDVNFQSLINEISKIFSSPLMCNPPMEGSPTRNSEIERFLIKVDCAFLYVKYADKHLIGSGKNGQRWPEVVDAIINVVKKGDDLKKTLSYMNEIASAIYTLNMTSDEINKLITAYLDIIEVGFLSGQVEGGENSYRNQFFNTSIQIKERLKSNLNKLNDSVAIRWDKIFSRCGLSLTDGTSSALINPCGSSGLACLLINRVSNNPLYSILMNASPSSFKWFRSIEAEISIGMGIHWQSLSETAEKMPNLINKVKAILNDYVDHCYGAERCHAIELVATSVGLNWLFSDYERDGIVFPGYLSKRGLESGQLCYEPGLIKDIEEFLAKNDSTFFKTLHSAENGYSSTFEYPKEGTQFYNFIQFLLSNTPEINDVDVEKMTCTEISARLHTVYGPSPINLSSPLIHRVETLVASLSNEHEMISSPRRRGP